MTVFSRRLRLVASAFAVLVASVGLVAAPAHRASAASTAVSSSSAVTEAGTGEFAGLSVTVSQTRGLVNQNIDVSWSGGTPTVPSSGNFYRDFLEIMQCWGDDTATGPDPSQCEYGGTSVGAAASGQWVPTRQLTYYDGLNAEGQPNGLVDPLETDIPAGYDNQTKGQLYMPFSPATQTAPATAYKRPALTTSDLNDYFDPSNTNEVDYTRTDADGTGNIYFGVQNNEESPGLGCGQTVADKSASGGSTIEPCWLVVVPRGDTEVDGSTVSGVSANNALASSPLSATNWSHRLVFPLGFEPVASTCELGVNEAETFGDEQIATAMSNWQPGLCAADSTTPYSFSELSDDEARSQLTGGLPNLDFVGGAAAPTADGTSQSDALYAPVAINALTVAFYLESPPGSADAGTQITRINLDARLMAKLLTQSYQNSIGTNTAALKIFTDVPKQNPVDLTHDPEFLALNPGFDALAPDFTAADEIPDLTLPFGDADAYDELWTWIYQDPAARDFMHGIADDAGEYGNPAFSGATVNPNYKDIQLPIESFPVDDPYCQPTVPQNPSNGGTTNQQTPLCGIALHPYFNTMSDEAAAIAQGNQGLRTTWSGNTNDVGSWGTSPAEPQGQIAILTLADAATAATYDLPTADLCSDAAAEPGGSPATECVGASAASEEADIRDSGYSPDPPNLLVPATHSPDPDAYPLTTLTYAATVPSELTARQGDQYAALLDYIIGPGDLSGQAPGDLPPGYAPLPARLATETAAAANILRQTAGRPTTSVAPSGPGGATTGSGSALVTQPQALPGFPTPAPLPPAGATLPAALPAGTVTRATLPALDLADVASTAADPVNGLRYVLLLCLLGAGLGIGAGPVLLIHARRLAHGWSPPH